MAGCQVENCSHAVSKAGHQFCLEHWKAERAGTVVRCEACGRWHDGATCPHCVRSPAAAADADDAADDASPAKDASPVNEPGAMLSSTKLGKHLGLSNVRTNLILSELGWIERYVKGWVLTDRGSRLGAHVKDGSKAPFVVWPASILNHPALIKSVDELTGKVGRVSDPPLSKQQPSAPRPPEVERTPAPWGAGRDDVRADFRTKFRGDYCTQDGHFVKSRAEALIDNWLYQQQIAHAYERRLPIEADCYCDFYIAAGKSVYIEYWGRESDPKYRARMAEKRAIYATHGLNLIELGDAELERLDDVLPRMLLRYGMGSV